MGGLRAKGSFVGDGHLIGSHSNYEKIGAYLFILAVSIIIVATIGVIMIPELSGFAFKEQAKSTADHIVINEVYYHPVNGKDSGRGAEWVEIYNPTNAPVNISGWKISDNPVPDGSNEGYWEFPQGTTINPGEYIVVTGDAAEFNKDFPDITPDFDTNFTNSIPDVTKGGSFSLADDGDDVHLFNSSGVEIDVMWYGNGGDLESTNAAPDVPAGHSIARYYNAEDTNNPSADFYDESPPTPKSQNGQPVPEFTAIFPIILILIATAIFLKRR